MIKCSIIFPVFESYEAVKRQILYMNKIGIPDDFEVILVDDGSQPMIMHIPHEDYEPKPNFKFKYEYRIDDRKFTKACAVNAGAKRAEGEWIWMMAIDWMVSKAMINFLRNCDTDCLVFPLAKYAILDENGNLDVIGKKTIVTSVGLAALKRTQWEELGGYDERFVGFYPSGDDIEFGARYYRKYGKDHFMYGPMIYGFPPDDKTEVCSYAMEDKTVMGKSLRPDIFYGKENQEWKEAETEEYWREYFDPGIEHSEKGFRRIFLNRYGFHEIDG